MVKSIMVSKTIGKPDTIGANNKLIDLIEVVRSWMRRIFVNWNVERIFQTQTSQIFHGPEIFFIQIWTGENCDIY